MGPWGAMGEKEQDPLLERNHLSHLVGGIQVNESSWGDGVLGH